MKNIFLRIFAIFIASAIFISCSKEKFTLSKSSETISTAKMYPPIHVYGGVSGTLIPAPSYGALKFYNVESNFTAYCFADQSGQFKISTLIPGTYRIMVIYTPFYQGTPPVPVEYQYLELRGIIVNENMVTELGDILLITK